LKISVTVQETHPIEPQEVAEGIDSFLRRVSRLAVYLALGTALIALISLPLETTDRCP